MRSSERGSVLVMALTLMAAMLIISGAAVSFAVSAMLQADSHAERQGATTETWESPELDGG